MLYETQCSACALRGVKMKDLVRTLLEQECAPK